MGSWERELTQVTGTGEPHLPQHANVRSKNAASSADVNKSRDVARAYKDSRNKLLRDGLLVITSWPYWQNAHTAETVVKPQSNNILG